MAIIAVSVVCNAYNHELYISKAIESFLMQKTNFDFEVLIHDDASTDKTAEIIREYKRLYPETIKPIFQSENKYSKGIDILTEYQFPRVRGKYVALCEGDDYWTDENKLQKQFDALERNPGVDICAHGAIIVESKTLKRIGTIAPSDESTTLSAENVIFNGGGYVATNSLMFRSSLNGEFPPFRKILHLDYTLQIHGALKGGMLYLSDVMSAYRFMSQGSWSSNINKDNEKLKRFYNIYSSMLEQLNVDTDFKYSDIIERRLMLDHFYSMAPQFEDRKVLLKEYKTAKKSCLSKKWRFKIYTSLKFPWIRKVFRKMRYILKKR